MKLGASAGLTGAAVGGLAAALLVGFHGFRAPISALIVGAASGVTCGLLSEGIIGALSSALFGGAGYLWGKFLDVNLHFERIAVWWLMKTQPGLSEEVARRIARLHRSGLTSHGLFREELRSIDAAWVAASAASALIIYYALNRAFRRGEDVG